MREVRGAYGSVERLIEVFGEMHHAIRNSYLGRSVIRKYTRVMESEGVNHSVTM